MKKTIAIILLSSLLACSNPVRNAANKIGDRVTKTCQVLSIKKSTHVAICNDNSESSQIAIDIIKLSVLERTAQVLTW